MLDSKTQLGVKFFCDNAQELVGISVILSLYRYISASLNNARLPSRIIQRSANVLRRGAFKYVSIQNAGLSKLEITIVRETVCFVATAVLFSPDFENNKFPYRVVLVRNDYAIALF